jgi:mono/diheme cytochrome c family protein
MVARLAASLLLTVLPSWAAQAQDPTALQQRGGVIARGMCSACHAVGRTGDSPHTGAPLFRHLDKLTDLNKLAQRLREGLLTGHEEMPMFRFNREDADAMVAYMRTIQGP